MELKDFVSQSIQQIFEGVKQAQSQTKEMNGLIAPHKLRMSDKEIPNHQSVVGYHHSTPIISVDFDISVTTQDSTKDKAGAGIFIAAIGLGGQVGSESMNSQLNKLRFSIPVILPIPENNLNYQQQ